MIRQGDIYWIDLDDPHGSAPGFRRPHLVVQNNVFNASRINTVLICPLTTNLARSHSPGNILLEKGEADLPQTSIVNVSQVITVNKTDLGEYIGSLSLRRFREVFNGIKLVLEPRDIE